MEETQKDNYVPVAKRGQGDFVFSRDNSKIFLAATDYLLHVLDAKSLEEEATFDLPSEIHCMTSLPSDGAIMMGGPSKKVEIFSEAQPEDRATLYSGEFSITGVEIHEGSSLLSITSSVNYGLIFNTLDEKAIKLLPGHSPQSRVLKTLLNPTKNIVATLGSDGFTRVYSFSVEEGAEVVRLLGSYQTGKIGGQNELLGAQMAWLSHGKTLLLPGKNSLQKIVVSGQEGDWSLSFEMEPAISHAEIITCVECFSNGRFIVTAGADKALSVWDYLTKNKMKTAMLTDRVLRIRTNDCALYLMDVAGGLLCWPKCYNPSDMTLTSKRTEITNSPHASLNSMMIEEKPKEERIGTQRTKMVIEEEEDEEIPASTSEKHKEDDGEIQTKNERVIIDQQTAENLLEGVAMIEEKERQASKEEDPPSQEKKLTQFVDPDVLLPQNVLHSSSTRVGVNGKRLMKWNLFGSVVERKYGENNSVIDVDFADKDFHKPVVVPNIYEMKMACLDFQGVLLASKPEIDSFPNKMNENSKSVLLFRKWGFRGHEDSEFVIDFQRESIENIAIGRGFLAAYTNKGILRIFNLAGLEIATMMISKPVVSLEAFETEIAVVFHSSMPISIQGLQNISYEIYQVGLGGGYDASVPLEKKEWGRVPVAAHEELQWIGFTSEGMLMMQDTRWSIALKVGNDSWMPVNTQDQKIWVVGMKDYQICGVPLRREEYEPSALSRTKTVWIKPGISTVESENQRTQEKFNGVQWTRIQLKNEKKRKENHSALVNVIPLDDPSLLRIRGILSESELNEQRANLEKDLVGAFRECIINEDLPQAQSLIYMMEHAKTMEIALALCKQLNLASFAEEIQFDVSRRMKMLKIKEKLVKESTIEIENRSSNSFGVSVTLKSQKSNKVFLDPVFPLFSI